MKVHDLEDKIMNVWGTVEDIDTFLYRYLDSPAGEMSEDDIANTLLGIKTLHDQRCQKLWDAFEKVLANASVVTLEKPTPEVSSNIEDLRGFDSKGDCLIGPSTLSEDDDEQRRRDSMGLEGLRSG